MSGREFKPGDVAMVPGCGPAVRAHTGGWRTARQGNAAEYVNVRLLVVIDPEDREQVERLTRELRARGIGPCDETVDGDGVANALREFANPTAPKPDEPTSPGAVVEDSAGERFVGLGNHFADGSLRWQSVRSMTFCNWRSIAAVRVLSEGVTS